MADTDNIVELFEQLKEEVDLFEQSRDAVLLGKIEDDFQRFAHLVTLFLVSERDSYYGYFFMAMTFKVDFAGKTIAGIRLNQYPPVFVTNPLILMKYSLKEVIYIFCHEVDHVLFNHPAEMARLNPEQDGEKHRLLNIAADAAVNDQLNLEIEDGKKFLAMPKGGVTSSTIQMAFGVKHVKYGESFRYYYDLIKSKSEQASQGDGENGGAGSDGQNDNGVAPIPEHSSQRYGKDQASAGKANKGGDSGLKSPEGSTSDSAGDPNDSSTSDGGLSTSAVIADQAAGRITDHEWIASEDGDGIADADELLAEAAKELVNEASEIMGAEARDMMPAHFTTQVQRLNRPAQLNWQSILRKYVGTIAANKQKTRSRLNRRQPLRYDLSGSREGKTLKIVVAIDTSASMSDEDIRAIFNEIFAIVSRKKFQLTVIECDAAIQRVYELRNPTDLPPRVQGRGGTAFTPVFKYVNEHRCFRDALLIYFTDGFGEVRIPKPLTYRNLWVILRGKRLSVKQPYGVVMPLKNED